MGSDVMRSPKDGEGSVTRFSVNLGHSVSIMVLIRRTGM